jgi:GH24 family phage-related lysozyme (muramidase)
MAIDRKSLTVASSGVVLVAGLMLGGPDILSALKRVEKQETTVYADKLAYGIPTVCSGYTDWSLRVGQDYDKAFCDRLDQKTAIEYGLAVVDCIGAEHLTQNSLDAMTLFAINVGKKGACGSRAAQLFRAGKHDAGCRAISRGPKGGRVWIMSGGVPRKGLANRRDFETAWCLKPITAPKVTT